MAFSKFDPHRPVEDDASGVPNASTPAAARRAWILKWAWWVTMLYTAIGFGFIAYWIAKS